MRLRLLPLACVATIFMAACSNELPVNEDNDIQTETRALKRTYAGLTEFTGTMAAAKEDGPITRSAAKYNGQLNFYYTAGDRVWIHNPAATPALRMDSG